MKRYSAYSRRFPAFYNHRLLDWRRKELGWSLSETARRARRPEENVKNVFRGKAKSQTVYPVCRVLGIDWPQAHNLELQKSEFHLAVLNGNGSNGSKDVG